MSHKKTRVKRVSKLTPEVVVDRTPVKNPNRFHFEPKNDAQRAALTAYQENEILFLSGSAGAGKTFLAMAFAISDVLKGNKDKIIITRPIVEAGESLGYLPGPQPLDAKILTPKGWTTMGNLKIGDLVIGRDGNPTKVINIFPKGKKIVYKVTTTDGTSTECCEDHLWLTTTKENRKRQRNGSVKSTKEIMETFYKNGKINHHIPRNEPVNFDKNELPLSPYTLGVLLGDGCLRDSISFATMDKEIMLRVQSELEALNCTLSKVQGISYYIKSTIKNSRKTPRVIRLTYVNTGEFKEFESIAVASKSFDRHALQYRCTNKVLRDGIKYEFLPLVNRWSNPVKNIIDNLGLLNKRAKDKSIPDIYKYSSVEDRINLLRGLMDTDGTVKKNGEASFTTISKKLAEDVIEIVKSLGGRAILRQRNRVGKLSNIRGRQIKPNYPSYEFNISLPESLNPFHLSRKKERFKSSYIHGVGIQSIEEVSEKEVQCILIENPEHLYLTDNYIVTHNTFEEKLDPYIRPLKDCLDILVGRGTSQRSRIDECIEIAPLAYMRGRTFVNTVCILDEAQNASAKQLKMFLTRLGDNSKMIITGDPSQSDITHYSSSVALVDVMSRLNDIDGIDIVKFRSDAIVRHPLVGKIVDRLGE